MLWTCIKKELLQMILTKKFQICLFVSVVLLGISLYVSAERYLERKSWYDDAVSLQRQGLNEALALDESEYDSLDWSKIIEVIYRKPTALSIFCRGKENNFGVQADLGGYRKFLLWAESAVESKSRCDFNFDEKLKDSIGKVDFIFIIKIVLSLFAAFLAFNLISGERENGTLSMIHAQNVSRRAVIGAKLIVGIIIISLTILILLVLSMLYLQLAKTISLTDSDYIRLILLFAASVLYVLVFLQVSLLFSCILHSSQQVILTVCLLWSITIFLIPTIANMIAVRISPLPPVDYVENEFSKFDAKTQISDRNLQARIDRNFEEFRRLVDEGSSIIANINRFYLNQFLKQRRTADYLASIFPVQQFVTSSEVFAGTSIYDYDEFMERVRFENSRYWDKYTDMFSPIKGTAYQRLIIVRTSNIVAASLDENRIPLRESILHGSSLLIWLVLLNGLLFFAIVTTYEKALVI